MAISNEEVVVRYRLEVDQLTKELDAIILKQEEIVKTEKAVTAEGKKQISSEQFAAQKRKQLISQEQAEIRKLAQLRKLAFDPKLIEDYNRRIEASKNNIATLRGEVQGFARSATSVFKNIGAGIAAAFSVQAIIQFGKASINAFLEAEENASRLKFAITAIGGESEVAFDRLIRQSEQLSQITVFSDDSIQQAQAALAAFNLTSDEIEKLIPALADFATITSQDIPAAAQQIGAALEGNGREFKKYGIEVSATATRTENLAKIMEGLAQQSGAAEEAAKTLGGQLKTMANRADELQESIGSRLAGSFAELRFVALTAFQAILEGFDSLEAQRVRLLQRQRDLTQERIEANIAGDAIIDNLTVEEEAKKQLLIVGQKLNDLEIKRQEAQVKFNEEKTKLFNLEEREAAQKALEDIGKQLISLRQEAGILKDIVELEKNRNDVLAKRKLADDAEAAAEREKLRIKELEELRKKELAELQKNQELLRRLEIENIEDLKAQRIAKFEEETKALTAKGELRAKIIKELEIQLVKDLNKIDLQRNVDPLFRVPEIQVPNFDQKITPEIQVVNDDLIPKAGELKLPEVDSTEFDDGIDNVQKKTLQGFLDTNNQVLDATTNLLNSLIGLYDVFAQSRIDQINRETDAELAAIDTQEEAIQTDLSKRRISEKEAEKLQQELAKRRVETEEKAAAKIRAIKRKQAILDKAAALIQIAIDTARGYAETIGEAGIAGIPLGALVLAAGAAQAAIVAAQPIPYKKGSKDTGSKGHMALVHKDELIYMPPHSKVLPARQTQKNLAAIEAMRADRFEQYLKENAPEPEKPPSKWKSAKQESSKSKVNRDAIDRMFLNKYEQYVMKQYITPALVAQKKENEKQQGRMFSENIARAVMINVAPAKVENPDSMMIKNIDQLADAIVKRTRISPYRTLK